MKRLLIAILVLWAIPALAAQQTVTVGTAETPADLDTNFENIQSNFTAVWDQEPTQWTSGTAYTADNQLVVHDGNVYVCTSNHTADPSTEPGTGVDWATVWAYSGAALYEPIQTAASQGEMEAGTESGIRSMSPLRVAQAIAALATGSDELVYQANCTTITDGFCVDTDDQSLWYYDGSTVVAVGSESDTLSDLDCSENQIAKWNGSVWACAADATAEAGTGDDLGDAVAADVVALFSGSSGYLKSDGTIDTPTDTDSFSSYTLVTSVGDPGTDTNVPSEQAVREAISAIPGGSGIDNVVEDLTPQLGGDLDLNSNDITGTGNVNITGTVSASSGFHSSASVPEFGFYDSDAAGAELTDEYAGGVGANLTTSTEDSEVSDLSFYYMDAGTKTTALIVDGSDNQAEFQIPTTFQNGDIDENEIAADAVTYTKTAGSYKAQEPLVGDPDSWTLTTTHHYGGTLVASSDGEDTLDAVAAGMSLTIKADDGVTAVFNPNAADTIYRNGVALAQGEGLVTDAAYGICVLQYRAANTWDADCSSTMTEETP